MGREQNVDVHASLFLGPEQAEVTCSHLYMGTKAYRWAQETQC